MIALQPFARAFTLGAVFITPLLSPASNLVENGDFATAPITTAAQYDTTDTTTDWREGRAEVWEANSGQAERSTEFKFQPAGLAKRIDLPAGGGDFQLSFDYAYADSTSNGEPGFVLLELPAGSNAELAIDNSANFLADPDLSSLTVVTSDFSDNAGSSGSYAEVHTVAASAEALLFIFFAHHANGLSSLDNVALIDPANVPPPTAPSNLALRYSGGDAIAVRFTDTSETESGFVLQSRVLGETVWNETPIPAANGTGTLDTIFTGLAPETAYELRVLAANSGGSSAPSPVLTASTADTASRPNIVLVLADDFGIDSIGAYGSDAHADATPTMDRLANTGLRFTRAYASGVCSPSRYQLQTGQYPFRNGCLSIDFTAGFPLPEESPAFARELQSLGYATAFAGKHLGANHDEWGWDFWSLGTGYWGGDLTQNGITSNFPASTYLPDEHLDFALDFIDDHADQPFFLYLPIYNPHVDTDGLIKPTPDSADPDADQETLYRDNIAYIDQTVADIEAHLDSLGLLSNTVILISGDNGTLANKTAHTVDGQKLEGAKRSILNGGAHVPLIVNWPAAMDTPAVLDHLVDFTDFLPTFVELAGAPSPQTSYPLDGYSFAPLLTGDSFTPREWIFVQGEYNVSRGLGEWYAQNASYRLNEDGSLWTTAEIPFGHTVVPSETTDPEALAARAELQAVLDRFDPESGITYEFHRDSRLDNVYHDWKTAHWNYRNKQSKYIAGDAADPDDDGLINLLEHDFGTDPNVADNSPTAPSAGYDTDRLKAEYPSVSGIIARITTEVSGDLTTFESGPKHVDLSTNGNMTTESDKETTASAAKRFMKIRIERGTADPQ